MNCFAIKKFQPKYTIKKTNKITLNPPSLTDPWAPPGSGSEREKGGRPSPTLLSVRTRAMAAATTRPGGGGGFRERVPVGGAVERACGLGGRRSGARALAGQGRRRGVPAGRRRRQRRGARSGATVRPSRGRPAAEVGRARS